MKIVTSKDGTRIAYDVQGAGAVLILVDGALCTRSFGSKPEFVELLARHFTVYSYDRRGRGDSGDTKPYAVEREIDDIAALIEECGGEAYLYGHSSGAALAFEAGLSLGDTVRAIAMFEAPYNDDGSAGQRWKEYVAELTKLSGTGRGGDSVALFMELVGMPAAQIEGMRHSPIWPAFEAVGPTLAYDAAVLGADASVPVERAARLMIPVLVLCGLASYPFMCETARTLSRALPHAELRALEGQTHDPKPDVLVPLLVNFFLPD
jgi:pimeloyl-ACP methyl ester carboxylesterase